MMGDKQYNDHTSGYDKETFGEIQYRQQHASNENGFGIASLVLGILSLVFFCTCINIPLAILAIIFAVIHLNRKGEHAGFAVAGIVTSAISFILTVLMVVVMIWGFGTYSWSYAETMPFEYFMDDDHYEDFYGDGLEDNLPFGGHHHGQDL